MIRLFPRRLRGRALLVVVALLAGAAPASALAAGELPPPLVSEPPAPEEVFDLPAGDGAPVGGTPHGGYLLAADDGSVHTFTAASRGSTPDVARPASRPVVDIAATPSGEGYWLTTTHGDVYTFGDARYFGSTGNLALNRPIVGMAATPTGQGYWLVATDGGIFTFGDARFFGSTGDIRLNQPIVGMASSVTGNGYWLVASDGGIFTYGDAVFRGSTGDIRLNRPVVGMAATRSGSGYWLVASDGGIFTYGDAVFLGSTGGMQLNRPIVGMAPSPSGAGYWLAASDGGVFTFGDATFRGAMESSLLDGRIVGLVPQGGDVRAPVLRQLAFGPARVDTSTRSVNIKVRVRITDDLSGHAGTSVTFLGPAGEFVSAFFGEASRVSGDARDGVYESLATVPAESSPGTFRLRGMDLRDWVGNAATVEGRTVAEAGYPTTFEQVGAGDTQPLQWQLLSVWPPTVDTSTGPATLGVRMRIWDDDDVRAELVVAQFVNGGQSFPVSMGSGRLVSGDRKDGVWESTGTLPQGSAPGVWRSRESGLEFQQLGPGDSTPPALAAFSFTPTTMDTSEAQAVINVTARVTDAGDATLPGSDDDRNRGYGWAIFMSPSRQELSVYFGPYQLVSGGPGDATYQATAIVPRYSEQGTWTLEHIQLSDRLHNMAWIPGGAAAAAGYPTTFEVIRTADRQERP